ncbi:aminotransferase class I/II-fold pyridoxal phosphate-dependent enzyme [Roseomonas sp. GC11]|uniref:aminotransferase class I/II-fold pyridoxal phosphate-dependent enzyme n=1 Tax=Roseomonas sp. GC11 TaxID=2950546 RepID=UPI00210A19A6|nr:aminotransferase class I/II-fold pyridoxal phosphate-dependent enzyme [Roseomonas sp. GC11]MCQ4161830.1 aminotransferase class I/II-fold pyridoxal phosphate-dependent enzyme [Roseomonas sp. GC11]
METPPEAAQAEIDPAWLARQLGETTMRGIARASCDLIRSGALPVGARLPSVRDLAREMGVSPATISAAWAELRRLNLVAGRGRNGMHVCGHGGAPHPARFTGIGHFLPGVLDLTLAVPDPALLPPLGPALAAAAGVEGLNHYARTPIIARLRAAVERDWPYAAQAFLAVEGGYEAVRVALRALVQPGARVAVEVPTAMRLLDLLDEAGAVALPVLADAEGPLPGSLAEAMVHRPVAFLFQPRTHSVTGRTVTLPRLRALADMLRGSEVLVLEDDGIGALSPAAPQSLGRWLPERVVHLRAFSKALGPDLRLAVVSAPAEIVARMQGVRAFGSGWTSRLLQEAAALLLEDPATEAVLARARAVYAGRRQALAAAMRARGLSVAEGDGLCLWAPVRDESFALVTFASRNMVVMPGAKCAPVPIPPHVRIATSLLSERHEEVAEVLALLRPSARPEVAAGGGV